MTQPGGAGRGGSGGWGADLTRDYMYACRYTNLDFSIFCYPESDDMQSLAGHEDPRCSRLISHHFHGNQVSATNDNVT